MSEGALKSRRYSDLQGLGRAMQIIDSLAERPMRAKELSDALGLKWTTAYRTLAFLREHDYVRRDGATGIHYVGPRLYSIGSSYIANLPIVQAARPYLRAACNETGTTAQLCARDRRRSIVLTVSEPRTESIPKTTIGFHFPLHCGSKGLVLLAYAPPGEVEAYLAGPFERLTPATIADPQELALRLAEIREQGYAVTRRDVQLSTGSVAAPVHDAGGAVIASVCLIAGCAELDRDEPKLVEVCLDTARSISLAQGWRPGVAGRASLTAPA